MGIQCVVPHKGVLQLNFKSVMSRFKFKTSSLFT